MEINLINLNLAFDTVICYNQFAYVFLLLLVFQKQKEIFLPTEVFGVKVVPNFPFESGCGVSHQNFDFPDSFYFK